MELSPAQEEKTIHERARKSLLWVAMISMVMVFAGLTSAYVVCTDRKDWVFFELPRLFYISTALIIMSSVTMNWAISSVKKNNFSAVKKATLLTLIIGGLFIICQFEAWEVLYNENIVFAGNQSNVAGSFLYVLTGLHLAHLIGGIFAVLVVWIKSLREKYTAENHIGLTLCAIFWHFLDVLWIYLFLFLLFVR